MTGKKNIKYSGNISFAILPVMFFFQTVLYASAIKILPPGEMNAPITAQGHDTASTATSLVQYTLPVYNTTEIKRIEWSHKGQINIISSRQIDSVYLPHNYAYLKIDFPVLEYNDSICKNYKYALKRKKNSIKWIDLGSNHYVILSKLRPGKHTLFVTADFPENNITFGQGKLDIYIASRFWKQWYMVLFYVFGFMALFLLFFRFQTRALRKLTRQFREREKIAQQIMSQKEELALKNKNITDSINYAKRIQSALMPSKKLFHSLFPESFVLHIPKDIVSGDFYWINEVQDTIFIAAVDCTGHGVPGAFMSIIGFELFRKLTNVEGIKKPSDILNNLNEDFQDIFKDVDNIALKDGMDIAFCSVNKKTRILEFAGAFNPLYLIRDNSIIEIKGDRNSVGLPVSETEKSTFENHSVQLQTGDIFYIFSDGFADQFGGPEGKKYKYRRFRHLLLALHHLPPERQHDFLYKSIMEWKGDLDQVDDILVIGVRVNF
ncbi:MAG: SpoIIE family protein phosphatase [Bacteroidales bacterium]|nr:SpoIIE family protein phosphatase [Bacteroidales bacterium]